MSLQTDFNSTTTKLLTLLNVSATKYGKRKRNDEEAFSPSEKLNRRKSVRLVVEDILPQDIQGPTVSGPGILEMDVDETDKGEDLDEDKNEEGAYESHFGKNPKALTTESRESVDRQSWSSQRVSHGKLGNLILSVPEGTELSTPSKANSHILERLKKPFATRQTKKSPDAAVFQNELLSSLATYRDLYLPSIPLERQGLMREASSLHILNHVTRKRRRVLKNNERLSHASKSNPDAEPPEDVQDQGFTRPSILILVPFRASALNWFKALVSHTPSPEYQIENQSRFTSEYGLPPGTVDKLDSAESGMYPKDHVELFRGNVDDDFRIGIKITRKSVKMFAEFYGCDIIMASPLGLKRSLDKEKNADYLSSIEILIMDQMDALLMQNWEHLKHVLAHMNQLPKEARDTDFSRIKPWYLDGHSAYLRQSILIAPFETPELRSLFNKNLKNISGRMRIDKKWPPIEVPEGVNQNFNLIDCTNPKEEPDKRFHYFTTQVLPAVLKSAVQSANTVVFVPSSFDFIRVHQYFRKEAGVSFTVLSEYSTGPDITRARQAFFSGRKAFLLISERFHFFRRYKIRGIRNIIFYGLPDHPQYYTEFLSYPFLDDDVLPTDITCRALISKYDWFRLERIAGTEGAAELIRRR